MTPSELLLACQDSGFTPSQKLVPALLEILGHPDRRQATKVIQALVRSSGACIDLVIAGWAAAPVTARPRWVELLGRLLRRASSPAAQSALLDALGDSDWKTRQSAIMALGKLNLAEAEERLLALWPHAEPREQRVLADALGKTGSERARTVLAAMPCDDPDVARQLTRAKLILNRTALRPAEGGIVLDAPLPSPHPVLFVCRRGLGRLVAEEVRALADPRKVDTDGVEILWGGACAALAAVRTALEVAIPVALGGSPDSDANVLEVLARSQPVLRAWSASTPRFRLSFRRGGHQRARVWRLAEGAATLGLINDSRQPDWEVRIDEGHSPPRALLIPKGYRDRRFEYRGADVPAASHPTLAAALALQSEVRASDVVWDPFVGSGLELIEVAQRSAVRALYGSDRDPRALAAAQLNFERAGVEPSGLLLGDAREQRIADLSLIVTNPPMGRRVARDGSVGTLLDTFLRHARRLLCSPGRLVWLSPLPARTARTARELGFRVERREAVDMGGFEAELQVLRI